MASPYGSTLYTVLTQPLFFALLPLLSIPRFYFISMINSLYNEKTSRKRVVRVGIISEIILPLAYIVPLLPFLIMSPWLVGGIPIAVPIPILFIAGMLMLRRMSTRGLTSTWARDDDSVNWWEVQSSD